MAFNSRYKRVILSAKIRMPADINNQYEQHKHTSTPNKTSE